MIVSRKTVSRFILMFGVAATLFAQSYEELGIHQKYFPEGTFADERGDGSFLAGWYSSQLRAMEEPPLSFEPANEHEATYRFVWLRTFHHPVSARMIFSESGTGTLRVKMADGAGGYNPGRLIVDATFPLTQAHVQHVLYLIRRTHFWQAPTELLSVPGGTDGAQWILEGRVASRYHVIDRWTPKDGPLRELGLYLVFDIAKLDIPKSDIY